MPPSSPGLPGGPLEKPLEWRGSSRDDLRDFPELARREAGHQLRILQQGEMPDDWKPMSTVGAGTIEIRIRSGTEHRVFVVAKFRDAIYVLHAFEKKTQKTPQRDIELARKRYQDLLAERRKQ
jgi:phage-related protein